jgi:eukaryotic-like serine/threonine-protein kinase
MQRLAQIEYTRIKEIGIGQGRNSRVYLIDEPQLGGELVAKEIEKNGFINSSQYHREAQALFAASNPNVVAVQYSCETTDHICLIMPYYANGSLADLISQEPLRPTEVLRVGQGMLSGISQIHLARQIHFDIKPTNILFSDTNQPMVADFGQARSIGLHGLTIPGPVYSEAFPPELITHGVGTIQSDIYQAGLTLYRAANGDPFFKSQVPVDQAELRTMILSGRLPDRSRFLPHVPKPLRSAIRKALQVDPAKRYLSALEFAHAIGQIVLKRNWKTEFLPDDSIIWTDEPSRSAKVFVSLVPSGSRWRIVITSERNGRCRSSKKSDWRNGMTKPQAFRHLKDVFERLER